MLVTNIQRILNSLGESLVVDGIYGASTKQAILKFQKENELLPTGLADQSTLDELKKVLNKPAEQSGSFLDTVKSYYATNKVSVVILSSVAIIGLGYALIGKIKKKA